MKFEEFKSNVERWAESRGIYAHSTPEAQLLKTLSELGELADAYIKNHKDELKDAIGDVAVCWVNYCKMRRFELNREVQMKPELSGDFTGQVIAQLCTAVARGIKKGDNVGINLIMKNLSDIASFNGLDFMECCEAAWLEIKDRKGRMVAGGAFVKEGDDE